MIRTVRSLTAATGAGAMACAFLFLDRTGGPADATRGAGAAPAYEKHYVTPGQLLAAGKRSNDPVRSFGKSDHRGSEFHWPGDANGLPLVLVFIKRDCPCSVEFEPYFQRLAAAHRSSARFVGVIDGDVAEAKAYAESNRVEYPVLADADHELVSLLGAENGSYTALVPPSGRLAALWPGCSRDMMDEMNRRLAEIARSPVPPIDLAGLPSALTTGCPFQR